MKYYGATFLDFTPNLSTANIANLPTNWRERLRVRRVYSHKVVSRYKYHQSFNKTGWADPSVNVPGWYTIYDAAYMTPILRSGDAWAGTTVDGHGYYYGYQIHYIFDTSFIGSNSLVVGAEITVVARNEYLPHGYTLCNTGVYCNLYVSEMEYINTRHQGYPVNVPADGSGFAARFGPYPARNPSGAFPRWDAYNSYDTVPLAPSAINKTGETKLTAVTSDFLTMSAGSLRYILGNCRCAWITVYYAST